MGRDPFGIFKEGEVHTISYNTLLFYVATGSRANNGIIG